MTRTRKAIRKKIDKSIRSFSIRKTVSMDAENLLKAAKSDRRKTIETIRFVPPVLGREGDFGFFKVTYKW